MRPPSRTRRPAPPTTRVTSDRLDQRPGPNAANRTTKLIASRPSLRTGIFRGIRCGGRRWWRQRRVRRSGRDPGAKQAYSRRAYRWRGRLRFKRPAGTGLRLSGREGRRRCRRRRRGCRQFPVRQDRAACPQPLDGLLGSAAYPRVVVALENEHVNPSGDSPARKQPVPERVGDVLGPRQS